jgi:hypothetical protein
MISSCLVDFETKELVEILNLCVAGYKVAGADQALPSLDAGQFLVVGSFKLNLN